MQFQKGEVDEQRRNRCRHVIKNTESRSPEMGKRMWATRIEANRRNARKSTGPKTPAGVIAPDRLLRNEPKSASACQNHSFSRLSRFS
jgi:hypothetical protein